MDQVWKEAEPKFKAIQKELADHSIKWTAPKAPLPKVNNENIAPIIHTISFVGLGKDLRQESFIINIGCQENLYKTCKQDKYTTSQPLYSLDLDGKTREQALTALNENIPSWIETAMITEDPFVIQVKIVCGKGSHPGSNVRRTCQMLQKVSIE
jgi:DNA-nicking Smr family endonuclease